MYAGRSRTYHVKCDITGVQRPTNREMLLNTNCLQQELLMRRIYHDASLDSDHADLSRVQIWYLVRITSCNYFFFCLLVREGSVGASLSSVWITPGIINSMACYDMNSCVPPAGSVSSRFYVSAITTVIKMASPGTKACCPCCPLLATSLLYTRYI